MARNKEEIFCNNKAFSSLLNDLYGNETENQAMRYKLLYETHLKTFKRDDVDFYSSPGRIEIVGNHTDHNGGKVLAAAVTVDTLAAVSKREDGIIEIKSNGYPMLKADTCVPQFSIKEIGTSTALIKGVTDYFIRAGKKVGGFSASMTSTVPKASGVSSSSSFELIVAEILNVLYNDGKLDAIFKAKASQYAENAFFGKPCGLMDQSAIALGGINLIDFKSFENPVIEKAQWHFDNLDIFVIATGGDHSNLTDDYAAIPFEMKQAAKCLGVNVLRETTSKALVAHRDEVINFAGERAYLRAEHFFEENERVEKAFKAINLIDENLFLNCVNESGYSSQVKLQNLYSPACGNRNLEEALKQVDKVGGVVAKRVHGGGFAGTILVLVEKDFSAGAKQAFSLMFGNENVFEFAIRESGATKLKF